jgi:hypothetical protein
MLGEPAALEIRLRVGLTVAETLALVTPTQVLEAGHQTFAPQPRSPIASWLLEVGEALVVGLVEPAGPAVG